MIKPFNNPWLVQRLRAPSELRTMPVGFREKYLADKPLDQECADYLNCMLNLDYMGSAEFEWGAFGKSLRMTVSIRKGLVKLSFPMTGIPFHWMRDNVVTKYPASTVAVYGFCIKGHQNDVVEFCNSCLQEDGGPNLKERTEMKAGLFGTVQHRHGEHEKLVTCGIVGWYDLDNNWLMTKDKNLAEALYKMLEL